ncbi:MAG: hypothetical protein Q9208_005339 [Pyrenodesmia sp. 3 TL-2023]
MRYLSFAALALVSAAVALPKPQESFSEVESQGDGTAPIDSSSSGDVSNVDDSSIPTPDNLDPIFEAQTTNVATNTPVPFPNTPTYTIPEGVFPTAGGVFPTGSGGIFPTGAPFPSGTGSPSAFGLLPCGPSYYAPDQYICYADFLCPILDGTPTLRCSSACYLESLYTCDEGALVSLSEGETIAVSGSLPSQTGGDLFGPIPTTFAGVEPITTTLPISTGGLGFYPNATTTGFVGTGTGFVGTSYVSTGTAVSATGTGGLDYYPTSFATSLGPVPTSDAASSPDSFASGSDNPSVEDTSSSSPPDSSSNRSSKKGDGKAGCRKNSKQPGKEC